MIESFIETEDGHIFLRHNSIAAGKTTLLFVHGLGESSLCFQEVFQDERFDRFNLLAPDLMGHGRSSAGRLEAHSFDSHVKRLWQVIEQTKVDNLVLVGHSLGGDLATLLCASDREGKIKKYVNVEGDITQFDLFITSRATEAARRGEFENWFKNVFTNSTVYEDWGSKYESCRRYYASLRFCRPEAFLANAQECYARNTKLPGERKSEIGQIYLSLSIPKIYCYGTRSLSSDTVAFLKETGLEHRAFYDASHWVMIDASDRFYSFLLDFASDSGNQA